MGHYRSEMGFEAEDAQKAKREKERQETTVKAIEALIEKHGLPRALMLMGEAGIGWGYHGKGWNRL